VTLTTPPAALSAPLAATALATTEPTPTTSGVGPSVQIGAFASMDLVNSGWSAAAEAASVAGHPRVVQPVQKGGHTLLRTLVTGFSSASAAGEFCSQLKAKGLECFVRR
jgi:cell division septation protein DedD